MILNHVYSSGHLYSHISSYIIISAVQLNPGPNNTPPCDVNMQICHANIWSLLAPIKEHEVSTDKNI